MISLRPRVDEIEPAELAVDVVVGVSIALFGLVLHEFIAVLEDDLGLAVDADVRAIMCRFRLLRPNIG